jgi:peptidoglycan/xylan/chitin deacetylase (PgdA/CDA1 family)
LQGNERTPRDPLSRVPVLFVAVAALVAASGSPASGSVIRDQPIPILMYHVIASAPAGAPYPDLYVGPGDFAAEVSWLARHGYHAVTLGQAFDFWHGRRTLPRRPIVISFDDGYRSQFLNALPVLRHQGWPGVLNLEFRNLRRSWGLSPRRVRFLIDAGWEVDSHTLTHPDLTTLDATRLQREVAGSRTELRRLFHVPVEFFCYPSGRYDSAVLAAVRSAGYLGATTTRYGLATPSEAYTLARVRVNGSDGLSGLAAKLRALGA